MWHLRDTIIPVQSPSRASFQYSTFHLLDCIRTQTTRLVARVSFVFGVVSEGAGFIASSADGVHGEKGNGRIYSGKGVSMSKGILVF